MISDYQLERNPQWYAVPWNPGIGPVKPISQTVTPGSDDDPYLTVSIVGPKGYSNMMAATHRPLMPVFDTSHIYYSFGFNLLTDANAGLVQVFEHEAPFCFIDSGGACWYANNSMQFNQVEPPVGKVQAYTPQKVWADTGIVIPKIQPESLTSVVIRYMCNMQTHTPTMSTPALEVNGKTYALPPQFQNIPMQQMKPAWAAGLYVQFQIGLQEAGGAVTTKYDGISVNWE